MDSLGSYERCWEEGRAKKMAEIGSRVAYARQSAQLTQVELAELIRKNSKTVSRLENGDGSDVVFDLFLIIERTGINPVWLFFGTGHRFLSQEFGSVPVTRSLAPEIVQLDLTVAAPCTTPAPNRVAEDRRELLSRLHELLGECLQR